MGGIECVLNCCFSCCGVLSELLRNRGHFSFLQKVIGRHEKSAFQTIDALHPKEHDRLSEACNGFETKSYTGNKFRAYLKANPEQEHKYKQLDSRAQAAEFRNSWAKEKYEAFKQEKLHRQTWQVVDRTRGTYLNFAALVAKLGGFESDEATSGALTVASKCVAMGRPWVMVHPQSNLLCFLYMEYTNEETFKQSWETWKTEVAVVF